MRSFVPDFAILAAVAGLSAMPLHAGDRGEPAKPPVPTLNDVLVLQARLDEIMTGAGPDERKIAEILTLKKSIEDMWPQLRGKGLEMAPDEAAKPAPDQEPPSELYFRGWLLSREAEKLEEDKRPVEALKKLELARRLFDRVARDFPDWKPEMVAGRRKRTTEHQAVLSAQEVVPNPR